MNLQLIDLPRLGEILEILWSLLPTEVQQLVRVIEAAINAILGGELPDDEALVAAITAILPDDIEEALLNGGDLSDVIDGLTGTGGDSTDDPVDDIVDDTVGDPVDDPVDDIVDDTVDDLIGDDSGGDGSDDSEPLLPPLLPGL